MAGLGFCYGRRNTGYAAHLSFVMKVTLRVLGVLGVDSQHTALNGLPFKCFRERNRQSYWK